MCVLVQKASVQTSESSAAQNCRLVAQSIAKLFATNFLIQICFDCMLNMSSIPQAAFAATKIRANYQMNNKAIDEDFTRSIGTEHPPAKYNSNFMKSIWGLYNRYSVHNMKKITEDPSADIVFEAYKEIEASKSPKGTARVGPKSLNSWSNVNIFEIFLLS